MAPLFHATTKPLTENEVLPAKVTPQISRNYKREVEDFLEQCRQQCRPQELYSRLSSWFAFGEEGHAALFRECEVLLHPELLYAPKLLYQVSMASPSQHPMVVAEGVGKLLSEGKAEDAMAAAKEYWRPTRD